MKKFKYIEKEERPWGRYFVIQEEQDYKIKRIEVEPGNRLSYQYHTKRSEFWLIVSGSALITINDKTSEYKAGNSVSIPVKSKHRVENKYEKLLVFIEIQTGDYFGEDDIIRINDDYGRI